MRTTQTIRGRAVVVKSVDEQPLVISGRLPRMARVRDEPFECITAPEAFVEKLKRENLAADIFTFMQELADRVPRHQYHLEWDSQAVLPTTTYDHWWKTQIDGKSRNMIRKAQKAGVEIRVVEFDDSLVRGIVEIYNESPIRQGKAFWHFGKDFETVKRENGTFLERSTFIGAFYEGELIGFAKFVRGRNVASLMQIISKIGQRSKAPSNALIAKAVEMCAAENIPYLHYGGWSKGGLSAFKASHAFVRHEVPRYFVPLNLRGRLMLTMRLHHKWRDRLPELWIERLVRLRDKARPRRWGANPAPDDSRHSQ
jgi:hypothetical protein